ncbi:hypothetical protein V1514DRAFT_350388 [Lipomyces japonicus]|uniref:uncharacterized protein n=1 Tax=Lipomyces japonicus TaxID=56871 RepID=UPI0034CFBB12
MLTKSFVAALALFASVHGASSTTNVCTEDERTANSQADIDNLSGCSTLEGNLILASTLGSATINGIVNITGNLIATNNSQITSIVAPSLATIGGEFELNVLTVLSTLSFPALTSVGSINWVTLPSVGGLDFTTGINSSDNVYISDTGLSSLDGINLTTVDNFELNNNLNLDDVEMGVKSVSNHIDISFNGNTAVSFPSLVWANNLTFQDVSSLTTPYLSTVNASYLLINNTFTSVAAPNLTTVGGLYVQDNKQLTNISFPALKTVGSAGIEVSNNTDLEKFSFPVVQTVVGAIVLDGDFEEASFPKLTVVRGAVSIDSTGDFNCTDFNDLNSSGGIRGNDYKCEAASTTSTSSGTATATSSVASATSADATTTSTSVATTAAAAAATTTHKSSAGELAGASTFVIGGAITAFFLGLF